MALPLPKVVADIEPGGGIVTSMSGVNALTQGNLENAIKRIQLQYAPITAQSEAASKLAYANLMGPQFMAKLMGNPDILANIPNQQEALRSVLSAAGGQGNVPISPQIPSMPSSGNPLVDLAMRGIKSAFGRQPPAQIPQQMPQALQQQNNMGVPSLSQVDQQNIRSMKPGDSYVVGSAPPSINASPPLNRQQQSFAENAGEYARIKEELKESGKINAEQIKDLDDTAFNANTLQITLDQLSSIVDSPEFRQIRKIPIAGQHELGWYAKFGTPSQKYLVGKFLSDQGQVVVNVAGQFKGAFRAGEQGLINYMKVNPADMPEVASGKLQGMSLLNKMLSQRSSLTARLMEENHISKGKAMEIADKQVNGKDIRDKIDNSVMVSIKNKKTGERKTISLLEARKLGVPNV